MVFFPSLNLSFLTNHFRQFSEPKPPPIKPGSCYPNPCGPYSICTVQGPRPVCECQPGYFGKPPNCQPECLKNSDCTLDKACINQKCQDPCPGVCGANALCQVVNHNPICSCPPGYNGDPFNYCQKIPGRTILSNLINTRVTCSIRNHRFRSIPGNLTIF